MKFQRPKVLTYQETIRFHGHDGPFLALGYKLGKYLNSQYKPHGIMGIFITVKTRSEKPFTCLIDGLQCSTFATSGKGNIRIEAWKHRRIAVVLKRGEQEFTYQITEKAFSLCWGQKDLKLAARKIFKTSNKELWVLKK
jgi:formylmethanofuran dehydrogenase subunit E